jgi:phytanoyl-CoA hydroxylase
MLAAPVKNDGFSAQEMEMLRTRGYVIVRGLTKRAVCGEMRAVAEQHLAQAIAPLEYETDVHYPGAPASRDAPGGRTIRRLLQAYARDPVFARWATSEPVTTRLKQLLGPEVMLSLAHHNCVMTKQPRYSSVTNWHRDIRYWSFEHAELISVWLALGREVVTNGCLLVLPGTQSMEFRDAQLDAAKFLRTDTAENQPLLHTRAAVELEPGDVLFFHCRLFHAAGCNQSTATKLSLVFTYHAADNYPLSGTRSASLPEVMLG